MTFLLSMAPLISIVDLAQKKSEKTLKLSRFISFW